MGDYNLAEVLRGQLQGQADPAETTRDIEAVTCEILHLKQELARNLVEGERVFLRNDGSELHEGCKGVSKSPTGWGFGRQKSLDTSGFAVC